MPGRPLSDQELESYDVLPRELAERVRIHRIPRLPGPYHGLTIGRRVLLTKDVDTDGTSLLIAHELVHARQWTEQGLIRFGVRYLASFVRNLVWYRNWDEAYRYIGFEREARRDAAGWASRRRSSGSRRLDR